MSDGTAGGGWFARSGTSVPGGGTGCAIGGSNTDRPVAAWRGILDGDHAPAAYGFACLRRRRRCLPAAVGAPAGERSVGTDPARVIRATADRAEAAGWRRCLAAGVLTPAGER